MKKQQMVKVSEWVFWYSRAITNQAPLPALVMRDETNNGVMLLTVFSDQGPLVYSAVHKAGSQSLKNRHVSRSGCWSVDRLDVQVKAKVA